MHSVQKSPKKSHLNFHAKNGQNILILIFWAQFKYPFFQSLKEAFKIFDKNGNGYIEAKELKSVTTTLGSMLTEEEFDAFWEEADVNHDGKLDYEEFIKIMSQY